MYKILRKDVDGYLWTRVHKIPIGEPEDIIGMVLTGFETYDVQDMIIRTPMRKDYVVYEVEVEVESKCLKFVRALSKEEVLDLLTEYGRSIGINLDVLCNPINPLLTTPSLTIEEQNELMYQWCLVYEDMMWKMWEDAFASLWMIVGNDIFIQTYKHVSYTSLIYTLWMYAAANTEKYKEQFACVKALWEGGCIPIFDEDCWIIMSMKGKRIVWKE